MPILLAALSALLYGGADFAGGFASRRNSVFSVIFVSQLAGILAALAAAPLVGPNSPSAADLLWGGAAGLFGALGLGFLYYGIGRGVVAIVSPLSALAGVLVPMAFGLILGEAPSALAWGGAALCLPATFLLTWEGLPAPGGGSGGGAGMNAPPGGEGGTGRADRPEGLSGTRASFLYGLLAGIGFGGFFIAVSRPGDGAGLWPLVAARCVSILAMGAAAVYLGRPLRILPGGRRMVLSAGLFDMGANIAFVLAARSELLVLVTVVTALYPAPTVLLARVFMGQRLGGFRKAGLLLAVAGAALIGAG